MLASAMNTPLHHSGWRFHTGTAAWLRGPPGARCLVGGAGVSSEVPSVSVVCLRIGDGDRCSRVGRLGIHDTV